MQVLTDIIGAFHKKYPIVSYDIFTANADLVKEQMEKATAFWPCNVGAEKSMAYFSFAPIFLNYWE